MSTREPGELSLDEMVQACRNIGYDLKCGQCAQIFYTGHCLHGNQAHDEGCSSNELLLEVLLALSPLAAVAAAYEDRLIAGHGSELDEHTVLVSAELGVKLLTVGDALAAMKVARRVAEVVWEGSGGGAGSSSTSGVATPVATSGGACGNVSESDHADVCTRELGHSGLHSYGIHIWGREDDDGT
jgi:hypothetical protein